MKASSILILSILIPSLVWAGPVNINTADAQTLADELEGIGLSRAKAIVEYRETHGAFGSADDLMQVEGVGPRILEANRDQIQIQSPVVEE